MDVKIIGGVYDQHIVQVYEKGIDLYFRDDELNCDINLKHHCWIDISDFICQSCGTQWGDELELLTCPCLED